ncbi:MAG: hypothetical protein WBD46_15090 [Acidobacteriaceae bacterium]
MEVPVLMRTLNEIERALTRLDDIALRNRLREVEDAVRQLDQENEDLALQNASLRQSLRGHGLPPSASLLPGSVPASPPKFSPLPFSFSRAAESDAGNVSGSPLCEPLSPDEETPRLWHITHFFTF